MCVQEVQQYITSLLTHDASFKTFSVCVQEVQQYLSTDMKVAEHKLPVRLPVQKGSLKSLIFFNWLI